jgi:protein tyrosine/serine phosphatase
VFEWLEFTKTLIHIIEEEEKEKEITTQFWENFTINVIPINYKSNDSFKTRKIIRAGPIPEFQIPIPILRY